RLRKPRVRNAYAISINDEVAALDQAVAAQLVEQRGHHRRSARIGVQDTDAIGPTVLRTRHERLRRRAAEQRHELAPSHSITSSASASSLSGISRPSVFAVLRLITSSNFVGNMTGRSAGLSPLRTRPT